MEYGASKKITTFLSYADESAASPREMSISLTCRTRSYERSFQPISTRLQSSPKAQLFTLSKWGLRERLEPFESRSQFMQKFDKSRIFAELVEIGIAFEPS
jgi:hypothetical protein